MDPLRLQSFERLCHFCGSDAGHPDQCIDRFGFILQFLRRRRVDQFVHLRGHVEGDAAVLPRCACLSAALALRKHALTTRQTPGARARRSCAPH